MTVSGNDIESAVLPDSKLWSSLDCAGFAIYRLRELELAQFGLTIEQSSILFLLREHSGSATISELEDETMRQPNSVSTLLNRMSKSGLIRRVKQPDKNRFTIILTKDGESLLQKISVDSLMLAFTPLSTDDKLQLKRLLNLLLEKARDLLGITFRPPFLRQLDNGIGEKATEKASKPKYSFPDAKLWSILNCTRYAVYRLRELELAQFGITLEQSSILQILRDHNGSTTLRDIEDKTLRQPNSISTLLNRMEILGLIGKVKKPGEKRFTIILTKEGEYLFEKLTSVSLEMVFSPLTPDDKAKLKIFLDLLLGRARNLLGISFRLLLLQYNADKVQL